MKYVSGSVWNCKKYGFVNKILKKWMYFYSFYLISADKTGTIEKEEIPYIQKTFYRSCFYENDLA